MRGVHVGGNQIKYYYIDNNIGYLCTYRSGGFGGEASKKYSKSIIFGPPIAYISMLIFNVCMILFEKKIFFAFKFNNMDYHLL